METTVVIELINSVGFPIVACAAMFYMNINVLKQQKTMIDDMASTVKHNTEIMKELSYQIGRL